MKKTNIFFNSIENLTYLAKAKLLIILFALLFLTDYNSIYSQACGDDPSDSFLRTALITLDNGCQVEVTYCVWGGGNWQIKILEIKFSICFVPTLQSNQLELREKILIDMLANRPPLFVASNSLPNCSTELNLPINQRFKVVQIQSVNSSAIVNHPGSNLPFQIVLSPNSQINMYCDEMTSCVTEFTLCKNNGNVSYANRHSFLNGLQNPNCQTSLPEMPPAGKTFNEFWVTNCFRLSCDN